MATTNIELHRRRRLALPLLLALPVAGALQDGKSDLVDVWKTTACPRC